MGINIAETFSASSRQVRHNTRTRIFQEHREQSVYSTLIFAVALSLLLICDLSLDSNQGSLAVLLRVLIASVFALSAALKWFSSSLMVNWIATYFALIIGEVLSMILLSKLDRGMYVGPGQLALYAFGAVLLAWQFSFKLNGPALVVMAVLPNLVGATLMQGFSHFLYASVLLPAFLVAALILLKLRPILVECMRLRKELDSATLFDSETDLLNYKGLEQSFLRLGKLGQSKPLQQFMLLIELDDFDKFKRSFGDETTKRLRSEIGHAVELSFRGRDITASLEEEFVCVLLNLSRENAFDIAERFRNKVSEMQIECPGAPNGIITCTVSIGIAAADPKEKLGSVINLARVGVNQARGLGGNHSVCI